MEDEESLLRTGRLKHIVFAPPTASTTRDATIRFIYAKALLPRTSTESGVKTKEASPQLQRRQEGDSEACGARAEVSHDRGTREDCI